MSSRRAPPTAVHEFTGSPSPYRRHPQRPPAIALGPPRHHRGDRHPGSTRGALPRRLPARRIITRVPHRPITRKNSCEICVSADTAARFIQLKLSGARTARRPAKLTAGPTPFAEELMLYVVHGWLHLAGYDDLEPTKKRRMRAAEARAMKLLRTAQALPDFKLIR